MALDGRLLPNPVGLNAEFYAHCAAGELRFQRCGACQQWRHPPRVLCPSCGSGEWSWERASGRAHVWSWTVTHRPLDPALPVPYAVVVAECEEGPRLVGNLALDVPVDVLQLDLALHVELERANDAVALVWFRP
jgi:uncharacterized OB-fold protein